MSTQNHKTRSRSAVGATLLSVSAVAFVSFIVGCPGAVGGIGSPVGLSRDCTALLQESADIGQNFSGNPGDTNFQCQLFANQIAIVDAGCFNSLPAVGPLTPADLRAAAVQGQQQLGCN